jgi:hypothetical protein
MNNIQENAETVLLKLISAKEYYLKNTNDYPNNSIIIDFFEIKNNIFVLEKTHMITLFKFENSKIHIYDPSNTEFSNLICKYLNKSTKNNLQYNNRIYLYVQHLYFSYSESSDSFTFITLFFSTFLDFFTFFGFFSGSCFIFF